MKYDLALGIIHVMAAIAVFSAIDIHTGATAAANKRWHLFAIQVVKVILLAHIAAYIMIDGIAEIILSQK